MSSTGNRFMMALCETMLKYGIKEFVIAIRDPDSDKDLFRTHGSAIWAAGMAVELQDEIKAIREGQRAVRFGFVQEPEQGENEEET